MIKPHNERKSMVVNFTFMELGPATFNDSCWWTCAVARSSTIAKVQGGWPRVLRDLL